LIELLVKAGRATLAFTIGLALGAGVLDREDPKEGVMELLNEEVADEEGLVLSAGAA